MKRRQWAHQPKYSNVGWVILYRVADALWEKMVKYPIGSEDREAYYSAYRTILSMI